MTRRVDWVLVLSIAVAAFLLGHTAYSSLQWIGRTFEGFLILDNRVVASAGLTRWPATARGEIYQNELLAINGMPPDHATAVGSLKPETPVTYTFRHRGSVYDREITTRQFDGTDYLLLFGALLINGIAFTVTSLMIRYGRPRDIIADGAYLNLFLAGLWAVTAADLYGPHKFFRIHALCETFLFAGVLHMAIVFPQPTFKPKATRILVCSGYLGACALAVSNQWGLYSPSWYRFTHQVAVTLFALSLLVLIASQMRWYFLAPSFETRQRVKVVAFGAAASLAGPLLLAVAAVATEGRAPQNAMSFTAILYPISIGYAVLRHDLLGIDALVRRSLAYLIFTALITLAYLSTARTLELVLPSSVGHGGVGVFLPLAFVLVLLPLRDRAQAAIDRVFFRATYDFHGTIESASRRLSAVADLRVVAEELNAAVGHALHPEFLALVPEDAPFSVPSLLESDPHLSEAQLGMARRSARPLELPDGGLAVPCRAAGKLIAILRLGRPLSGRFYGAQDRLLLQTLANQAAIALQNALAVEQLRELNRDLEVKVEERTRELRDAHAQLIHREKMASLGQFVAGIAHELNNPLNFIQGNLACAEERFELIRGEVNSLTGSPIDLQESLADISEAFSGAKEGIERSTSLVRDLGTFARRDSGNRAATQLNAQILSSVNLLRSRLHGIELDLDLGDLPEVQCIPEQLHQVFVNLIANAIDSLDGAGSITIRSWANQQAINVEIEDNGPGIRPEHIDRIFDPFFTTKAVGSGTGLGLAISYGIVTRHGGRITCRSSPSTGTSFAVVLPTEEAGC